MEKKLSQEEEKVLHYALFWLKDILQNGAIDKTYQSADLSVLDTINELSKLTVKYTDTNLTEKQFKELFKDKWNHIDFTNGKI